MLWPELRRRQGILIGLALGLLFTLIISLLYQSRAVDSALTYMLLLPVLGGALFFGPGGALGFALLGALAIGPYQPEPVFGG